MSGIKTNLVKIGNSQGIRIPKTIIRQCGLKGRVSLEVVDGELIIRSADEPRKNWQECFEAENKDETKVAEFANQWDETEWEW